MHHLYSLCCILLMVDITNDYVESGEMRGNVLPTTVGRDENWITHLVYNILHQVESAHWA